MEKIERVTREWTNEVGEVRKKESKGRKEVGQ